MSAAFLHTPPFPVALTAVPAPAAAAWPKALAARGRTVGGVNTDPGAAEAFACAWHALTGDDVELHMRNRLFRLGELHWPDPRPPGRARVAGAEDRSLLIAWSEAFHREVQSGPENLVAMVDDRLSYRGLTLWEDAGQPLSMAGLTRMAAGQVRVGPVYTPPGLRGKGYAGAVTAAVSQAARDAGPATCCCSPTSPTRPATPSTSGSAMSRWRTGPSGRSATHRPAVAPGRDVPGRDAVFVACL